MIITDSKTTYKKQYSPELVAFVDKIAKTPSGPERWKLAIKAWLMKNEPVETADGWVTAREYNAMQIAHNKVLRDNMANKFGANQEGTMRLGLAIPEGAWQMVKVVDPLAFRQLTGNAPEVKRNLKRFMETFPEYTIAEKV